MASTTSPQFKKIDCALAQYYQHLNIQNYVENNSTGLFVNYIKTQELDDPQLPIENELGDNCDPYDCTYTEIWMNSDKNFPVPPYAQIPHKTMEAFIFYILQYCYKYGQPPSDNYIQTVLVPQCNGTINLSVLPQKRFATDTNENEVVINFYVRRFCEGCFVYSNISHCIQLYLLGEEGAMYCIQYIVPDEDSFVNEDDAIADIDKDYAKKYYITVSKNKRLFCMEMKRYYKASYGKAVKLFEDLQNNDNI